jgi:hypothetical protein
MCYHPYETCDLIHILVPIRVTAICYLDIGTMDKIQIIDRSNTAPSSNTFRDEYRLVYDENIL